MNQFLIVSDTHGDRDILKETFDQWRSRVSGIFYNGDSELAANDDVFEGVYTVIGNMDMDSDFQVERSVDIAGITFYQTHGHLCSVRSLTKWADLTTINQKAAQHHAQVVLFGHTHIDGAEWFDDKLFINPGSISIPKGPHAAIGGTYAILTVDESEYRVTFYNRQHEQLPELTQLFNK